MPNYTPTTATVIGSLPYSVTQDVSAAPTYTDFPSPCQGTGYFDVWYVYTTSSTETVLSLSAYPTGAGYAPVLSIWLGVPPLLTAIPAIVSQDFCGALSDDGADYWFEVPVEPNTTYYFQIEAESNSSPGSDLLFQVVAVAPQALPAGSLMIPNDTAGYRATVLSAADGTIIGQPIFPAGEFGTQLNDGTFCVADAAELTNIRLLSATLDDIATVDFDPQRIRGITSDRNDTFYVVASASVILPLTVTQVAIDGTLGTSWTLPDDSIGARGFAVARDGSIFYYVLFSDSPAQPIHRYDLTNSIALSDLMSGFVGKIVAGEGDGIVAADGTIWFCVTNEDGTNGSLKQLSTAGAVLQSIAVAGAGYLVLDHYALNVDDASIWIWFQNGATSHGFKKVRMVDGVVTTSFTGVPRANGGRPVQGETAGVDDSCPLLVLMLDSVDSPLTLVCPVDPTYEDGVPYSDALVASGGTPPYVYAITAGSLPDGLTLNVSTGVISGTPTETGVLSFSAMVTDDDGNTASVTCEQLAVVCPSDTLAFIGTEYSSFVTAVGGTEPYAFDITAGALPTGLSLDADTGEISGTPIVVGYYEFTVRVTDGESDTDTADCSITISQSVTYPICRKIRFPLPFNQNLLMFLQRLEFLIQSGVSSNASITINLSRDGGYTWPITRSLTAGALGDYDWRVYSTNFGQGRNWVCEFITDEPAFWALIQCYADMEQGTS